MRLLVEFFGRVVASSRWYFEHFRLQMSEESTASDFCTEAPYGHGVAVTFHNSVAVA